MKIVNIVCSGDLHNKLNLNSLFEIGSSVYSYNPEVYPGAYIKLTSAKVTLYGSGKYIIVGIKSNELIKPLFDEFISILSNFIDISLVDKPKIRNMVVVDDLGKNLNLNRIILVLEPEKVSYEPEQFPGLIYKNFGASFLLFQNGKVVITGLKSFLDAENAMNELKKMLII